MKKLAWLGIFASLLIAPSLANAIDLTPPASDASVMYLSYIFGVVNGVLSGSGTQILGKMFGVFNMAVLMLASLVAVYTTIMAVLNTGQDGEFLGKKWSSLFVPVRMLFGVLIISPTSTGYSWIQVAVMWIVLQGIGSANYVWQEAILYLQGGGSLFVANQQTDVINSGSLGVPATVVQTNQFYSQTYNQMVPLSYSVFCLEAMNTAITALTTNPAYNSATPANIAPPTVSPFNSVMNTVTADISMTSSGTPTQTINMPNYPIANSSTGVSAATNPDVNWNFLNGVCGTLTFNGGTSEANSDGTYTNSSALGLQQALYDLDTGIYAPLNAVCSVTCQFPNTGPGSGDINANCTTPPAGQTLSECCQIYSSMLISSSSNSCAAPTGYNVGTVTNNYNFPTYAWTMPTSSTIGLGNETISNATNAYLGLVSTYTTGGSGLPSTYSWLSAGDYFYQLMSYVGGVQSLNNATFSVSGSTYGNLNQGNVNKWAGIPATQGSSSTAPYLQPCGNSPCVNYPNSGFPSTSATTSINGVAFLEGIMLPIVATGNMSTNSNSSNIYLVGNFTNLQANQNSSANAPMTQASDVTTTGGEVAAGFLSILTGNAYTLYMDIQELTNIDNTATNPISVLMQIGDQMINMVFDTWIMCITYAFVSVFAVSFIPCMTVSFALGIFFLGFFSLVVTMVTPLLAAGAMLLFYFPMIPFMIYTFGVIGWVIGVIEGMVAAPIVGIGIMHPEGHDIFGKGEQALMLLLNMFLRPPLMVFGLITSIMMVYVSVWLVNSGINNVVNTIMGQVTGWSGMVAEIAIPIVYTTIIFNIVEKCFSMIHILPDKVTRWLSGGMQESLGSDMSGVVGQVKQGTQSAMSSYGAALGKAAESSVDGAGKNAKNAGKELGAKGATEFSGQPGTTK